MVSHGKMQNWLQMIKHWSSWKQWFMKRERMPHSSSKICIYCFNQKHFIKNASYMFHCSICLNLLSFSHTLSHTISLSHSYSHLHTLSHPLSSHSHTHSLPHSPHTHSLTLLSTISLSSHTLCTLSVTYTHSVTHYLTGGGMVGVWSYLPVVTCLV